MVRNKKHAASVNQQLANDAELTIIGPDFRACSLDDYGIGRAPFRQVYQLGEIIQQTSARDDYLRRRHRRNRVSRTILPLAAKGSRREPPQNPQRKGSAYGPKSDDSTVGRKVFERARDVGPRCRLRLNGRSPGKEMLCCSMPQVLASAPRHKRHRGNKDKHPNRLEKLDRKFRRPPFAEQRNSPDKTDRGPPQSPEDASNATGQITSTASPDRFD